MDVKHVVLWVSPTPWTPTAWWTLSILVLVGLVSYLVNHINKLNMEIAKYKAVWSSIRSGMDLAD